MTIKTLLSAHPYILSIAGTWLLNNVLSVLVSNLPAPTATSSAGYVYFFKVSNGIIGNLARAKSTTIQDSPNWQAALTKLSATPPARQTIPQGKP